MKRDLMNKVWTMSITIAILQTCVALWDTSQQGFDGLASFISPLILISITFGLLRFKKKAWVFSWMGFFILGYLANIFSKDTATGMIGSFILMLLVATPVCYFFMRWTQSIWGEKKATKRVRD